jgi:hypothetical protein
MSSFYYHAKVEVQPKLVQNAMKKINQHELLHDDRKMT